MSWAQYPCGRCGTAVTVGWPTNCPLCGHQPWALPDHCACDRCCPQLGAAGVRDLVSALMSEGKEVVREFAD